MFGQAKYSLPAMIRITLADDHRLFLDGLLAILAQIDDFQVIGTAHNGQQVMEQLRTQTCDVVVMDINMPVADGLATAQLISEQLPLVKVVLVSMNANPEYVKAALRAGVLGYVLKESGREEMEKAIRHAAAGKKHYSPEVMLHLASEYMPGQTTDNKKTTLTQRELQVLALLAQEYTAPEIGGKLFISAETVETHKKNMLKKLKLKNSYSLVKYALQNGLL